MSKNLGRITVSSSGFLPDSDRSHQCPAGRWNCYKSWKKGLKKADRDGWQHKYYNYNKKEELSPPLTCFTRIWIG